MPLLFMENECEPQSMDSLSAEECSSNTSGLEREEQPMGPKVTKRREKNRDAARKSRKKQTERADELHQELQQLEQSNSALQREIAALKKDQKHYEMILERHKPHCRLKSCTEGQVEHQSTISAAQVSTSTSSPAGPSPSSVGLRTLKCTKETKLPPSASSLTTTVASSSASSAKRPSSSRLSTFPYSDSFFSQPPPHSLFSEPPLPMPSLINATPSCVDLIPSSAPSAAVPLHQSESTSLTQSSYLLDDIFSSSSSDLQTSLLPLKAENRSVNPPQLYPDPSQAVLSASLPDPASQFFSTFSPACLEPRPVLAFPLHQSYDQQVSSNSSSLLSSLTVPSPPNATQTTSSMDESIAQASPSLPTRTPLLDVLDLSLSELLENNGWIMEHGTSEMHEFL